MNAIPRLDRRRAAALFDDETGAATAEYAITTMATIDRTRRIPESISSGHDPIAVCISVFICLVT